jgi:ketosteroid isomerase-like protein
MSNASDETAANKELVLRYMTLRQAGEVEEAAACTSDDYVRMGPRPTSGRIEGHPGLDHIYVAGTLSMEVEHVIAEGPFVAAQFVLRAVASATGAPYENYYFHLFECHDGRITAQWEYLDTAHALRTLKPSV